MRCCFKQKGQSILELAIFGSILIGLLGILINYGLKFNYQQKAMMQAFRQAYNASQEGGSYTLIVDKHIPDPANAFGFGSVSNIASSAGVTRNYHMQEVAENYDELPQMIIEIKGSGSPYRKAFKTAGFRYIANVPSEAIEKYEEIYGSSNVCSDPDAGCGASYAGSLLNIKIIDPCEGELMNYSLAKKQCNLITNQAACERSCQKGGKGADECGQICSHDIEVPWYCDKLDSLFAFAAVDRDIYKTMGVSSNTQQDIRADNILNKSQRGSTITAADRLNWYVTTHRTIYYKQAGLGYGQDNTQDGYQQEQVDTTVSQDENWDW
jgi:hypothetical protein